MIQLGQELTSFAAVGAQLTGDMRFFIEGEYFNKRDQMHSAIYKKLKQNEYVKINKKLSENWRNNYDKDKSKHRSAFMV
jgi:hypothetical protein